ncbi:MAG: signal peptide peptidase SppA [Vicinamibacterales bacterium]
MAARRGVALVIFLILLAVMVSAAAMLVVALVATPSPTVPANASLTLKIEAPFSEIEPSDVLRQFLQRAPTLRSTIETIHRAKSDSRVKVLIIKTAVSGAMWAQLQEVHAALEDFKTSGKPLIAFLESGSSGEYYVASAATHVVMMPAGQLDVAGLASYELFFRGALDKIGVYPDLLHIGEYKTAANTFTEKGFTAAHREMTRALNRDWYDELVRSVARDRKITEDQARAALGGGPYLGDAAVKTGLVDELAYEDQLDDKAPIQGTQAIENEQYARTAPPARLPQPGGRIALLYAVGTIASGKSSLDSPTGLVLGSQTFVEWVRKVRIDPSIRAVVVRVDSPGGSAIASEVIWRELMLTREVKPLVISMGDVAASGGYYIAAPADVIVAQPGTLTGSIGVVTGKFVVRGALDKLGVGTGSVGDGESAEIYSPFRPFTPAERSRVEEQMQATYELFLRRVAEGRHQTPEKIDAVGQGRVWTGHQARELGLVDELGGLEDALRIAQVRAKLDPAGAVDLVVYPAKRSFYDILSSQFGSQSSTGLTMLGRRSDMRAVQSALSLFQLFRRGEPLAILPNVFMN